MWGGAIAAATICTAAHPKQGESSNLAAISCWVGAGDSSFMKVSSQLSSASATFVAQAAWASFVVVSSINPSSCIIELMGKHAATSVVKQ